MKYRITTKIERIVEANDEEEAGNKFWEDLEEDNDIENTTTENRLTDNMVIKKIRGG